MLRRNIMTFVIAMAVLLSGISKGQDFFKNTNATAQKPTCEEALASCDLYVGQLEMLTNHQAKMIHGLQERNSELETTVDQVDWYIYILVGAAAGMLAWEAVR